MPESSRSTASTGCSGQDEWDDLAPLRRCLHADFIGACAGAFDAANRLPPSAVRDQLAAAAVTVDDAWHAACAGAQRFRSEVSSGHLDAAAEILGRHRELTQRAPLRLFDLIAAGYESVLALAAGRFGDAEAAARRVHVLDGDDVAQCSDVYALQMLLIRREEGRHEEVLPVLRSFAHRRAEPVWQAGLTAMCADVGLIDEARHEFEVLLDDGVVVLTQDAMWPATLAFLAEGVLAIGDVDRADAITQELAAFRGHNLVAGSAAMVACLGPADRLLGGLAAILGRPDEAGVRFHAARQLARRSESPVWQKRVEHDWARSLPGHSDPPRTTAPPNGAAPALSAREVDVLQLVASGCSNREIGQRLFISANTAANHVRSILQKTGCANRAQAVAFAARRHLLDGVD